MDLKPVITNFGDEKLYAHLSPEIERRLPQTCIEWERSLGASKTVFLQASFIKFNASNLVSTADTRANISKQPFLHLYWTGCLEFDEYKSGIKDSILGWLKHLKDKGIKNWLVIQVYSQDGSRTNKPKLQLPRGSVFDKIKNELCNRDHDKCIQLWEPAKETLFSRSIESWQALLRLLRQLLLGTIEQHLRRFEDKNRNFRECYAQPDWSFTKYFILHEELALILKSVTLHEDALVKYDELDALLSQFIINSEGRGYPTWLHQFKLPSKSWDGISLQKERVRARRDLVYDGKASLLDLRNYLFARQCQLLSKLGKSNDIAKRLHELVYSVRKEIEILKVQLPNGGFSCWVSLSCLYFLQYFQSKRPSDKSTLTFLAQTTDYARQKIQILGKLCNLLPSESDGTIPNKEGGVLLEGLPLQDEKRKESDLDLPSRLMESLSCRKTYELLYIDVCDRTEKLLTSVGHLRFAMKVRIDLARFYILLGEHDLSEGLLKPAVQIYKEQRWSVLHADVLMLLSQCHLARNELDSYLVSLPMLCCANSIDEEQRKSFTSEFLRLSQDLNRISPTLDCEPVLNVLNVKIKLFGEKGHVGDVANVEITLRNNFPHSLPCQEVCVGLKYNAIALDALSPRDRTTSPPLSPRPPYVDQYEVIYDVEQEMPEKASDSSFNTKLRYSLFRRNHLTRTQILQKGIDSVDSPDRGGEKGKQALLLDPWAKHLAINGANPDSPNLEKKPTLLKLSNSDLNLRESVDTESDLNSKKSSSLPRTIGTKSISLSENSTDLTKVNIGTNRSKSYDGLDVVVDTHEFVDNHEKGNLNKRSYVLSESISATEKRTEMDTDNTDSHVKQPKKEESKEQTTTVNNASMDPQMAKRTSVEIEPEGDVQPVEKLVCKDVTLAPGVNIVNVSAKICHEGRYALRSLTCKSGVVLFYQWLGLKRRSRAFFMVIDPPKFKWTSKNLADILLVGSKQRLRISIANGPGVISENSIVRLTSSTGLLFHEVPRSSVQLHPVVSEHNTREGVMSIDVVEPSGAPVGTMAHFYLPFCQPHESMNVYIDVTAPVNTEATGVHMTQHEIQIEYLWLSEYDNTKASLISVFYEPFAVEHKLIVCNERRFVQVSLRGLNPVWLILKEASLKCTNCYSLVVLENFINVEKSLNGEEEFVYIWEITSSEDALGSNTLEFDFEVTYFIKDNEESNPGVYRTKIALENNTALLLLDLEFNLKEPESFPVKDQQLRTGVRLKNIGSSSLQESYGNKICFVFEDTEFWQFPDHEKIVEFDIEYQSIISFKVTAVPIRSGWIPYPIPRLMYYQPEEEDKPLLHSDSIDEDEVWVKRKEKGASSKLKAGRLLSSRRTSSSLSDSALTTFGSECIVCLKSGASVWVDDVELYTSTAL